MWVLITAALIALMWTSGACIYRWVHGAWLRPLFWPFALGICMQASRRPAFERRH